MNDTATVALAAGLVAGVALLTQQSMHGTARRAGGGPVPDLHRHMRELHHINAAGAQAEALHATQHALYTPERTMGMSPHRHGPDGRAVRRADGGILRPDFTRRARHEAEEARGLRRYADHMRRDDGMADWTVLDTTPVVPKTTREAPTRDEAIAQIKAALKRRSNRTWSVRGGHGTAWGWITVNAPPARTDKYGSMTEADQAELSRLFGEKVHHQGVSIPSSGKYYRAYVDRAQTGTTTENPQPYWD